MNYPFGFEFGFAVLVWGFVAAVAHELTHYAAARAFDREATVVWRSLNSYHAIPPSGPTAVDRIIGMAPFVTGVCVAVGAFLTNAPLTLPMWLGLAFYTIGGGYEDFRVEVIDLEEERVRERG